MVAPAATAGQSKPPSPMMVGMNGGAVCAVPEVSSSAKAYSFHAKIRQKIAVEASRQCGRSDIPAIGEIATFARMLRAVPESGLRLIPWEEETTTGISAVLRDPAWSRMKGFILVIGPEGGFSAEEIELARRAGFLSVSLGKRVLRVETASLALLAILQYEIGARETGSTA